MAASRETHPSLLLRIRDDSDSESWSRFVEIYAPAIYGFLQKQGLQDADAADLTQDVLVSVSTAIKSFEYRPVRGQFRGWLFTVVQNKLRNFWRSAARQPIGQGESGTYQRILEHPDAQPEIIEIWEQQYEHQLFVGAAQQVKPLVSQSTWEAFWSTVVDGESTASVGCRLNMSPAAVRLAKARVIARIKAQIPLLEGESE